MKRANSCKITASLCDIIKDNHMTCPMTRLHMQPSSMIDACRLVPCKSIKSPIDVKIWVIYTSCG